MHFSNDVCYLRYVLLYNLHYKLCLQKNCIGYQFPKCVFCNNFKLTVNQKLSNLVKNTYWVIDGLFPRLHLLREEFTHWVSTCFLLLSALVHYFIWLRYEERLQQSLMSAISVPMKLAQTANSLWPELKDLATVANIACKSDLQVWNY